MLMTRAGKETVVMTIENMWDWMELFDNGIEGEIELELDAENLDVFFPDWDTYIDEDNPFGSLKMEDINAIKTLHILIADDVQEVEDLEGEGTYDVVSCNCELADQAIKEEGGEPNLESFLSYTGMVTFKITPNHPLP